MTTDRVFVLLMMVLLMMAGCFEATSTTEAEEKNTLSVVMSSSQSQTVFIYRLHLIHLVMKMQSLYYLLTNLALLI